MPLAVGATLVPGRPGEPLVGTDLHDFLTERGVTALCCVPTVLATLPADLPTLRWLLVSGEACPQDLVRRWHRDGRVMLNAYGPTETTVTSSLGTLHPDRAVTIGAPLPTYTMIIVDPDHLVELPRGATGEIAIADVCVARGYLNRPELTDARFVVDTLGLPDNPGGRIYRSGDLGRIGEDGEIVYLARIDSQVKLRGYRIELGEIETAIMAWPGIAQTVVQPYVEGEAPPELVAYVTRTPGAALDRDALFTTLAARLPRYMVPAYVEELTAIPLTAAQKVDRRALPPPRSSRLTRATAYHPPADDTEAALAEALHAVLGGEPPSVRAHLFDELGAHSLLMARFCAFARTARPDLGIAMRDVYAHPTIAGLAAAVRAREASDDALPPAAAPLRATAAAHVTAGVLQALFSFALACGQFALSVEAIGWVFAADSDIALAGRAIAAVAGVGAILTLLPIASKGC